MLVRLALLVFVLVGCKRSLEQPVVRIETRPASVPQSKETNSLTGVWTSFHGFAHGVQLTTTTTVAPDGTFVCKGTVLSLRSRGTSEYTQEGTIRVENGFLVQIVTNDTQRGGGVSETSRSRIVRVERDELWLEPGESTLQVEYTPTNESVLRRSRK
jgi:hypothetical protein